METKEVIFGPESQHTVGEHRVYVRDRWSDDWSELSHAHCVECSWPLAPSMPTAIVSVLYGEQFEGNTGVFARLLKSFAIDRFGQYIKIEFDVEFDSESNTWKKTTFYGVISDADDRHAAAFTHGDFEVASGEVVFSCFGLEKILADTAIVTSFIAEPESATGHGHEIGHALSFNGVPGRKGPQPNKSAIDRSDAHLFENNPDNAEDWSSFDILNYLLRHMGPRDNLGNMPFKVDVIAPDGVPPKWDKPVIKQEGHTLYSLINQVVDRRRMMVWRLVVDESETPHAVNVEIQTINQFPIDPGIPESLPIPANSSPINIRADLDQLTNIAIRHSGLPLYDQVIVRGARMRSVGTFSYEDESLTDGWTGSQKSEYDGGWTGGGTRKEQTRRDEELRGDPRFKNVYALFKIPATWDFKVGDGAGGAKNPMFTHPDLGGTEEQYYAELFVEQTMPLLNGIDYGGDKISDGTIHYPDNFDKQELAPLVFFRRPDKGKSDAKYTWVKAEDMGNKADVERTNHGKQNERISVRVSVPQNQWGVYIKCSGPQHSIAAGTFTKKTTDPFSGSFTFKDNAPTQDGSTSGMVVTLSLRDHRYAEARIPKTEPAGQDKIRHKVIYAGEEYTRDYVAPGTVLGISASTGQLIRSTGGYIPKVGPDDHVSQLEAIALMASSWYTTQHYVLALNSYRAKSQESIKPGDMIVETGGPGAGQFHNQVVRSIVSEIRFHQPRGDGQSRTEQLMTVMTWAGELDAASVTPFLPPKPAKRRLRDSSFRERIEAGIQALPEGFDNAADADFFGGDVRTKRLFDQKIGGGE